MGVWRCQIGGGTMTEAPELADSISRVNASLVDGLFKFSTAVADLISAMLRLNAALKNYKSNNWLKMHGRPMRRKMK